MTTKTEAERLLRAIYLAFGFCLLISCADNSASDFPNLSSPYLGQKPPGMTPEVFAPGIISTDANEASSAFLYDASVFVYRRDSDDPVKNGIFFMKLENEKWTEPISAPFDSKYSDGDFTAAPDGKTLYFTSSRPLDSNDEEGVRSNIWVTQFLDEEWSDPRPLEYPVNTRYSDSFPSVTETGTVYFFSRRPGGFGKADVYRSRLVDSKYAEVENLGPVINTAGEEWDPFIAHDESFLIFCSTKPGGYGRDDLYISFHKKDGMWTEPVNLGEYFNSFTMDNRPYITPDRKYFFFISGKSGNRDVYWVDAEFIEELKPEELK
jgi:hypothetical protein